MLNHRKVKNLLKNQILNIWLVVIFLACLYVFYCLSKYVEQVGFEYCSQSFCFKILTIGEFLTSLISIFGIFLVVHSLNAWKANQKYIEKKDLLDITKKQLANNQIDIKMNYCGLVVNNNPFIFIRINSDLEQTQKYLKRLDFDHSLILNLDKAITLFVEDRWSYKHMDQDDKLKAKSAALKLFDQLEICQEKINDKIESHKNSL